MLCSRRFEGEGEVLVRLEPYNDNRPSVSVNTTSAQFTEGDSRGVLIAPDVQLSDVDYSACNKANLTRALFALESETDNQTAEIVSLREVAVFQRKCIRVRETEEVNEIDEEVFYIDQLLSL